MDLDDKLKLSKYKDHYHQCIDDFNLETLHGNDDHFDKTVSKFTNILESIYNGKHPLSGSTTFGANKSIPNFTAHWIKALKNKIHHELISY